ncbi:MAG: hypothetical protein C5B55_08760, partial [Blastocatellia bacterium]
WLDAWLGRTILRRPAFRMALVAALVIIVLGGIAWLVRKSRLENERFEAEKKSIQQPSPSNQQSIAQAPPVQPSPQPTQSPTPQRTGAQLVVATLLPGGSRGGSSGNTVSLLPDTTGVKLTLVTDDTSYANYVVEIQGMRGGKPHTISLPKPKQNPSHLTFELPATLLPVDDYMIKVDGVAEGGARETVDQYTLSIRRSNQ